MIQFARFKQEEGGTQERGDAWGVLALLFAVLSMTILIPFGRVTGDEGLYLNASKSVWEGQWLYRDFLFNQMPLLPYVYAPFLRLMAWEIVGARMISCLLYGASLWIIWRSLRRRYGTWPAGMALVLLAFNLSLSFDCSQFKTQPLTWFLLSIALSLSMREHNYPRPVAAGVFLALASFQRLSLLPLLPLFFVAFMVQEETRKLGMACLPGIFLFLLLCAGYLFISQGKMFFGVLTLHGRYHEQFPREPWVAHIGFLLGFLGNQGLLLFAFLWAAGRLVVVDCLSQGRKSIYMEEVFCLGYLAITVLHATRSTPYPIHQTSIVPLAIYPIAWLFSRLPLDRRPVFSWLLMSLCVLQMPFQECEIRLGNRGSIRGQRGVAAFLASLPLTSEPAMILDPGLAVMAGLKPLKGYELGEFSYIHHASDADCEAYHLVNYSLLLQQVDGREAGIFCLRSSDFSALSPRDFEREFLPMLRAGYQEVAVFEGYGQFEEELFVFLRRQQGWFSGG